jgi:hypothetical protein
MNMETNKLCALCSGEGVILYKDLPDRLFGVPGVFNFRECVPCGVMWLDPRPTVEDIAQCYRRYYTHTPATALPGQTRSLASLRDKVRSMILCGHYGYQHIPHKHNVCFLGNILGRIPYLRRRATYSGMGELLMHFKAGGYIIFSFRPAATPDTIFTRVDSTSSTQSAFQRCTRDNTCGKGRGQP